MGCNCTIALLLPCTNLLPLALVYVYLWALQHMEPLPRLLAQEHLTDQEVHSCRLALFEMLRIEEANLLGIYSTQKGKKKYATLGVV